MGGLIFNDQPARVQQFLSVTAVLAFFPHLFSQAPLPPLSLLLFPSHTAARFPVNVLGLACTSHFGNSWLKLVNYSSMATVVTTGSGDAAVLHLGTMEVGPRTARRGISLLRNTETWVRLRVRDGKCKHRGGQLRYGKRCRRKGGQEDQGYGGDFGKEIQRSERAHLGTTTHPGLQKEAAYVKLIRVRRRRMMRSGL